MESENLQKFIDAGVDYEDAMARFGGNSAIFVRILKKFADDKSFQELSEAVRAKDAKGAELAVHSLKGVSGNLSLMRLHKLCAELNQAYRDGRPELEDELFPRIADEYAIAFALVNTL